MGRVDAPRGAGDVLNFWRSEPRAPGLAGHWSCDAGQTGPSAVAAVLKQLWCDPGGFGVLGMGTDEAALSADLKQAAEGGANQTNTNTDPDAVGEISSS